MKSIHINTCFSGHCALQNGRKANKNVFFDVLKIKPESEIETYKGLIFIGLGLDRLLDQIQN